MLCCGGGRDRACTRGAREDKDVLVVLCFVVLETEPVLQRCAVVLCFVVLETGPVRLAIS